MIRFTPEFAKTYLGATESCVQAIPCNIGCLLFVRTTFTIPEGVFPRSYLLSLHVFLLAILFRHEAFLGLSLTRPKDIEQLRIHTGENELCLPLRPELDDVFMFRRAVNGRMVIRYLRTSVLPTA